MGRRHQCITFADAPSSLCEAKHRVRRTWRSYLHKIPGLDREMGATTRSCLQTPPRRGTMMDYESWRPFEPRVGAARTAAPTRKTENGAPQQGPSHDLQRHLVDRADGRHVA